MGDGNQKTGTIPSRRDPAVAAALAWAVPGAGHFYAGKRGKAALFFALISGTFFFGLLISGFKCVSYTQQPYWFIGQVFAGIASLATAFIDPARDSLEISEELDVGTLFTTVAGLLNLLVVLNAIAEARKPAQPAEPAGTGAGRGQKSGKADGK